jgi:hypothetical protein
VAAIERLRGRLARLQQRLAARATRADALARPCARAAQLVGALAGVAAVPHAGAVDLPEDRADAMYHRWDGGGTTADGPALLVRKSLMDRFSLSAFYYLDMVSNASIDVVTYASPYKENRNEYGVGFDYSLRNGLLSLSATSSREPDYQADAFNVDIQQESFGGMTTTSIGFSRGSDKVGRKDLGFFDEARHWRYRAGVTQILTRRYQASLNAEVITDDGYLGNPYRSALVLGARVPENVPRTRTGRAIGLRISGAEGSGAVRFDYRYYWDTWDISAHTFDWGFASTFGSRWVGDAHLRYYRQDKALFYSDNAQESRVYVSRNRQLSTFYSVGVGAKLTYNWMSVPNKYDVRIIGALERTRFDYKDFTDLRTGRPYSFDANLVQLTLSATF